MRDDKRIAELEELERVCRFQEMLQRLRDAAGSVSWLIEICHVYDAESRAAMVKELRELLNWREEVGVNGDHTGAL